MIIDIERFGENKMWFNPIGMGPFRSMGMGPYRRGGLRMLVFQILQQSPRNGAEIMDQIEIISQGWWRPSPGSVYPLLYEMQEEGIIRKQEDGKYVLTEKGMQENEGPWRVSTERRRSVGEMVVEMNSYISYLEDLAKSDKSKIIPYLDNLKSIRGRLAALLESQ